MALDLYGHAVIGCRKIIRVLEVFSIQIGLKVPHHTTIRQWIVRYGCHSLETPLEQADDWLSIGDLTICIGKLKCLAILGVRMSHLESRADMTLSHKDVEVLGLYPTEKSTGEFIEEAFEDSAQRVGGEFLACIVDQGSDIKMGVRLFKQNHCDVKILHDISHKLSNVLEHELKNDTMWSEYIQQLNMTRKRAFQTELAVLMPKKQREKARFMDISNDVQWPDRIRKSKSDGHMTSISEKRYQDYFGWMDRFVISLDEWNAMVNILNFIKDTVRRYGISKDIYAYLEMVISEAAINEERLQKFSTKALSAVSAEVEKLNEGQTMICSTEVIESIFGKFKAINECLQGITSNVLGMCSFIGRVKTIDEIKAVMEKCSVKKAQAFIKEKFGQTLCGLRKVFFPSSKRTEFDMSNSVASTA